MGEGRAPLFPDGDIDSLRQEIIPEFSEMEPGTPLEWQSDPKPHVFVPKAAQKKGDPGWDGDPDSCAVCDRTWDNPIHDEPLVQVDTVTSGRKFIRG